MMLSNHMYFIDFELAAMGTLPYRVNNVMSIDGYYRRPWLIELIGGICTRKYTMDLHLIKSINRVLKRGDILSMYPEARYSPCGITSYMPESLGKLIKMNKVPVVAVLHHGNYLHSPFWNFRQKRKVPLYTTMTQILTAEQVKQMSVDEINKAVQDALTYDDYQYQKDNGILIIEPFRAEGLHKVLYQCPHCKAESKMASKGAEIYCTACGKRWFLREDGQLEAKEGETEFPHIPDWFRWEREQVREQIENGTYHFEDEVEVYGFPRCWRFIPLGKGKLTHDIENGFTLTGHYRGEDYRIERTPPESNSLHIEYDYCYIKPFDCVDISTEKDSYYCYPTKENVVTKLAFATEELFLMHQERNKAKTR
jgi:DNA-directed RNA polymerase subunit RPC12/RpoP